MTGKGIMVASSRKGKASVRSLPKPQNVHTMPANTTTNANRIMKNSEASFPRMNKPQATVIQRRPRRSGVAATPRVSARLSQDMYRAGGGRRIPCDQTGYFHQSRAISIKTLPNRIDIKAATRPVLIHRAQFGDRRDKAARSSIGLRRMSEAI